MSGLNTATVDTLHLTNGESAAGTLRQTGIPGMVISWDDVLHEGPVPANLSLEQMSDVRARFIAGAGWGSDEQVRQRFADRDSHLLSLPDGAHVFLWFEHDLYDQLQLIQLLDWFAQQRQRHLNVELINIGAFPGHPNFGGLGELTAPELASLYVQSQPVTETQLALARAAWSAFTAPEPTAIVRLLDGDTSALPFLGAALTRHLEQFPSADNGLPRTERQILETVSAGAHKPVDVFQVAQRLEGARFMGDMTFWSIMANMAQGHHPLLTTDGALVSPSPIALDAFIGQSFRVTNEGAAVLSGRADAVRLNGIDRWLGGVHLYGETAAWRYDSAARTVIAG